MFFAEFADDDDMPFIFLLLFGLICLQSQPGWPQHPSWLTPEGCAILVGTMVLTSWLLADLIARTSIWQITRQPELRSMVLRRYSRWRRNHFIGLLVAYLLTLYWLGWGKVFRSAVCAWFPEWFDESGPSTMIPGFEIALLAPFFLALILSWERFYRVEKVTYDRTHYPDHFISRRAYLLLQIRHQLLLVMPPVLLLLLQQLLFSFFTEVDDKSYLAATIAISLMGATFVAMPLLLRVFLGLKPLPPGPLRDRLEQTARRLNFRYANILLWHTRHQFANALVTGFIPWIRYIVLTDRLIDELTPEEIEAVFGHEIGHIKHHHLLFYMAFFLASFILLGLFWEHVKDWLRQDDIKAVLTSLPHVGEDIWDTLRTLSSFGKLGLLAAYILIIFGFISRRCERQADLFGSRVVSTEVFINALEKVAAINGIPRDRSGNWLLSWQHPTIAQRVEFLERLRDNPTVSWRFHLSTSVMQLTSLVLLVFLLWHFDLTRVWQLLAEF